MAKEIFEAFEGQQDVFGFSQVTKVGDTIYVAGTMGIGRHAHSRVYGRADGARLP